MKNEHPVDFFIVGFAKAGTTTLYHLLSQSRHVYFPAIKEINFFATGLLDDAIAHYGSSINTTNTIDKYNALFKNALPNQIKGDASPAYIEYPEIAKRIADYNPSAKIIIVLREPTRRAISHYLMDRRLGFCKKSLGDIIESADGFFYRQYIEGGHYSHRMAPYFINFPKQQIKVILLEELVKNPEGVISDLCNFLGISYEVTMSLAHENQNIEPRNSFLKRIYAATALRSFLKHLFPAIFVESFKKHFFTTSSLSDSKELEQKLRAIYAPELQNLKSLTGLDFSLWE